jgi:hypothetical protein
MKTITTLRGDPALEWPGRCGTIRPAQGFGRADFRLVSAVPLRFLFYHFRKDPATGAQWLLKGVPRVTNQQDEWALQNVAAAWIEKGYQTANAAGMVDAMAANSPPGAFRNYLQVRADRLRDLAALQDAATRFRASAWQGCEEAGGTGEQLV